MSHKNPLIIVAPSPTPFKQDQVDFSAIEHNVERWMTTDLDGFVLGTENGEETYLSEKERLDIVRHVCFCVFQPGSASERNFSSAR